jgi:GT2 family glycosyltransferase
MDPAKIAIIVLNWNNRDATLGCLESLQRAELRGASILIVDNGSRDGSVAAIRDRFPDHRLIALPENQGYAGGNNAGIRAALEGGAEGVLLLNNDTEVAPDFLRPLLWAMESHPMVAGVCSAIHRHDRPEMLDVAYCKVVFSQHDAVKILGVNALPGQGFEQRCEIEVAVGCSLLLRADVLRQVGLLDEAYFAYHEDVDWCLRAHKLGYRFYYEPMSRVFHRPSSSTSKLQEGNVPAPSGTKADDLPNAEPLPWNPIRTYLGARNLVRLLRTYATPAERRAFVHSCLYEIPLEVLAVIHDREGWMRLHRWRYGDALRMTFVDHHSQLQADQPLGRRLLTLLLTVPVDLLWRLPRRTWAAYRTGRFTQLRYHLQGLIDGWRDRPLPLQWLGLR